MKETRVFDTFNLGGDQMDVIEVMFTTWVGWPIYTALAMLLGTAIWEKYDESLQEKERLQRPKLDMSGVLKNKRK